MQVVSYPLLKCISLISKLKVHSETKGFSYNILTLRNLTLPPPRAINH